MAPYVGQDVVYSTSLVDAELEETARMKSVRCLPVILSCIVTRFQEV